MKFTTLFILLVFFSILQFGCDLGSLGDDNVGTAHIKGIVFDATSEARLDNVSIESDLGSLNTLSDNSGNFFFLNLNLPTNPKDVKLTASKTDYNTAIITTTLRSGDTSFVYIPMSHK